MQSENLHALMLFGVASNVYLRDPTDNARGKQPYGGGKQRFKCKHLIWANTLEQIQGKYLDAATR